MAIDLARPTMAIFTLRTHSVALPTEVALQIARLLAEGALVTPSTKIDDDFVGTVYSAMPAVYDLLIVDVDTLKFAESHAAYAAEQRLRRAGGLL